MRYKKTALAILAALAVLLVIIVILKNPLGNEVRQRISTNKFKMGYLRDEGKITVTYKNKGKAAVIINRKNKPDEHNIYVIKEGNKEIIPLNMGNGTYTITLADIEEDNTLQTIEQKDIKINLDDPDKVFDGESYYTELQSDTGKIIKQVESASGNNGETIENTYEYIRDNIEYDDGLASLVEEGKINTYRPNIDNIIKQGKGICIDQSALMVEMLRKLSIRSRVVVGYSYNNQYHAWVEVWTQNKWKIYDPTYGNIDGDKELKNIVPIKYY